MSETRTWNQLETLQQQISAVERLAPWERADEAERVDALERLDDGEPAWKPQPIHRESIRIGRNAPCPCGSGKKYKNCCLKRVSS